MEPETIVPQPGDSSPLAKTAAVKTAVHASESGHWYNKQGQIVEQAMSADGKKFVKCTLAHARKLDLARGCTSVIKLLDKPALTMWLRRQSVLSALTLPRLTTETESEWMARVEKDADERSRKAAEMGSAIHAAVQAHVGRHYCDEALRPFVDGIVAKLPTEGGEWNSEVPVINPMGYGTKLDLLNEVWLLDMKGKDGDQSELDSLTTYDEHAMQLAAGHEALLRTRPAPWPTRFGILFFSRTHAGAASLREVDKEDMTRGWDMFRGLLSVCHSKDRHWPWEAKR